MAINEREFTLEKKILKKVNKLLNNRLDELRNEVRVEDEELKEFKKMVWSDSNSFDNAEIEQVKNLTMDEEDKVIRKQKYYKRLNQIKDKPYFASIIFKDQEGKIYNIYLSLTYLKDDDVNNILYDWRSPICSLFYDYEIGQCKYLAPEGEIYGELKRKRQYKINGEELISVFDNSLNIDDEVLQDVLAQESSDKMKNVVNTIQKEQNQVIRNLEDNNLIVQGIAGSGKTTVALHRIAFLLYQLKNLNSNNILVFSPNNIFTEYISDVLPSLGENNTLQTTFSDYLSFFINEYKDIESYTDYVGRYYKYLDENKELIKYKQSDEIISDLNNYLEDYINNCKFTGPVIENEINIVTEEELNHMLKYKYDRLPLFERLDEMSKKMSSNFYKGSMKKAKTFGKLMKEEANFKKDYKEIYKNFWLSKFTKYRISEVEVKQFINKDIINYEDALLFSYIKGTLEGFPYEVNIKQVVIDEAQDYNKLQYIIINKIFRKADYTILGDINQNINPYYSYTSLQDLEDIFNGESRYLELLKTYRSSPEIINYTNKILNLNHVNAIRKDNNKPIVFRKNCDDLKTSMINDINTLKSTYKSVAVITKDFIEAKYIYDLIKNDLNISLVDINTKEFIKDLVVIPAYVAKGLEFDSVIIYNDRNNSYRKNERNLLYVACTRAQHELYIYN